MKKRKIITIIFCAVLLIFGISAVKNIISDKKAQTTAQEQIISAAQEPVKTITISAAGDCTLATDEYEGQMKSFKETAAEKGNSYFMNNVRDIFADDDLTIVNFEGTLSENGRREEKQFAFRGKPSYAEILTEGNIEAACLSNNHSRDYGEISNTDTHKILSDKGIITFDSLSTAVCDVKGIKVGLVGINHLNDVDRTRLENAVDSVKAHNPDIIIACIHWGVEKATEPTEEQIQYGHRAIDLGADLVIGTHPHVLQGIEEYNGGIIAYSLGNFCFGGNDSPSDMDTIIYRQTFKFENGSKSSEITIVPCTISSNYENGINNYQPTPATGSRKEKIINKMNKYISDLGDLKVNYYR